MRNQAPTTGLVSATRSLVELNETDLRKACPAIFSTKADPRVSERYSFTSTADILPVLRDHDFIPTGVQTRMKATPFSKHAVEFFHSRDLENLRRGKLGEVPRIILTNSHDRSSRLVIMAGFYRLVCSNGMVVSSGAHSELRAMHIKLDPESINKLVHGISQMLDGASQQVEIFKNRKVSKIEQSVLANYAVEVRYRNYEKPKMAAKELLTVRRDVDKGDDLWSVFNRIQENVMVGGLPLFSGRKSGGVKSFEFSVNANRRLWAGAEALNAGGIKAVQALRETVSALQGDN